MLYANQDPNSDWTPHPNLLPLMFSDGDLSEFENGKTEEERSEKVNLFEAGLAYELSETDTLDESLEKIVKVALVSEYGTTLAKEHGFKRMVDAIKKSIEQDPILRKQALIIADRFTGKKRDKNN